MLAKVSNRVRMMGRHIPRKCRLISGVHYEMQNLNWRLILWFYKSKSELLKASMLPESFALGFGFGLCWLLTIYLICCPIKISNCFKLINKFREKRLLPIPFSALMTIVKT